MMQIHGSGCENSQHMQKDVAGTTPLTAIILKGQQVITVASGACDNRRPVQLHTSGILMQIGFMCSCARRVLYATYGND